MVQYILPFHLGRSPFEVLYGRKPRNLAVQLESPPGHTDVEEWLKERNDLLPVIRHHLERAQKRMQVQADKNRSEREFAVGDHVYLRLQPYVQTSVAVRSSQKLGFKYFGPYLVLQRIGKVAYRLQLPPTAKIHPVVHVSQLKKAVKSTNEVSYALPIALTHTPVITQPGEILQGRLIQVGGKQKPQVLIKWDGLTSNFNSWEPLYAMIDKFPDAPVWGQAVAEGEGG